MATDEAAPAAASGAPASDDAAAPDGRGGGAGEGEPVHFVVTGFGPFMGVDRNPTTALVDALRSAAPAERAPAPAQHGGSGGAGSGPGEVSPATVARGAVIDAAVVLETSRKVGGATLQSLHAERGGTRRYPRVWLHFGVHRGIDHLNLEAQGVNDASFRCPDQQGEQPWEERIVGDDSFGVGRRTPLDVAQLASRLRDEGHSAMVSFDAGRFLCNWVYYSSLSQAHANGDVCLFVHVPDFTKISESAQLNAIKCLIGLIADDIRAGRLRAGGSPVRAPATTEEVALVTDAEVAAGDAGDSVWARSTVPSAQTTAVADEESLARLMSNGFSRELCERALAAANGDVDNAAVMILTGEVDTAEPTRPAAGGVGVADLDGALAAVLAASARLKAVVVVRHDLRMGAGKAASQCCHGESRCLVGALLRRAGSHPHPPPLALQSC